MILLIAMLAQVNKCSPFTNLEICFKDCIRPLSSLGVCCRYFSQVSCSQMTISNNPPLDIPADKASLYMPVLGEVDPACGECKARRLLPQQDQMFIYLHAVKYVTAQDTYLCPLPSWCKEEWVPEDLKIKGVGNENLLKVENGDIVGENKDLKDQKAVSEDVKVEEEEVDINTEPVSE